MQRQILEARAYAKSKYIESESKCIVIQKELQCHLGIIFFCPIIFTQKLILLVIMIIIIHYSYHTIIPQFRRSETIRERN